jgi:hypothetical protein
MIKTSADISSPLGGWAVPLGVLRERHPDVWAAHDEFHNTNPLWGTSDQARTDMDAPSNRPSESNHEKSAPEESPESGFTYQDTNEDLAGGISTDLVDPTKGIPIDRDRLGLSVYVSMFAAVIADQNTPMPLSIGIFGEWGSGKSYFMGLVREQVDVLARSESTAYADDIVQIGFNAWHYADSNLWASLGDEIFRQLTGPVEQPENQREHLREELAERLSQRKDLEATTAQARAETARLQAQLDAAVTARDTRAIDLMKALKTSPVLRDRLQLVWKRLGIHDEVEQGRMLAEELRGVASEGEALRRSLAGRRGRIVTAVAVAALALLAVAALLPSAIGEWLGRGGLATLAALAAGCVGAVARVRSGLQELREVAGDLRERTDEAAEQRQESELGMQLDALRQAEANERVVHAQLDEVVSRVGELGRQLTDLAPGVRLYRFLSERAGSDAYVRHLGLISTIRKDFEQLIALMDDWRRHPGDESRRPIDRIVLYIDDLDRCSPQQVVDVLQAVHLLLALDLFVVVVGVDPRWLLRSLRRQYRSILTTPHSSQRDELAWETTPEDYLEKIFNIPFSLPAMGKGRLEQFLQSLTADQGVPGAAVADVALDRAPSGSDLIGLPPFVDLADSDQLQQQPAIEAELPVESGSEAEAVQRGAPQQPPRPLTQPELQLLAALEPLIDTPREAKRLLNLYRLLRSTRDLSPASRFLGDDGQPGEYQAVIILLGLLTTHARLLGQVLDTPPSEDPPVLGGLLHRPDGDSWANFIQGFRTERSTLWMNAIAGPVAEDDIPMWHRLGSGIQQASNLVTLTDLTAFRTWAPQIRRFSFVLSPLIVQPLTDRDDGRA